MFRCIHRVDARTRNNSTNRIHRCSPWSCTTQSRACNESHCKLPRTLRWTRKLPRKSQKLLRHSSARRRSSNCTVVEHHYPWLLDESSPMSLSTTRSNQQLNNSDVTMKKCLCWLASPLFFSLSDYFTVFSSCSISFHFAIIFHKNSNLSAHDHCMRWAVMTSFHSCLML